MSKVAQRIPEQEEEDGSDDSDLSIHTWFIKFFLVVVNHLFLFNKDIND